MRRVLRIEIAASAAFWVFVTTLYLLQIWWLANQPGERLNLQTAIVWQGGFYLCWIPITVLVWRFTAAWSPSVLGWPRYLAQHLALAVVAAIVQSVLIIAIAVFALGAPPNEPLSTVLIGQLRGRGYFQVLIYAGVAASGHALWLYDRWREREVDAARLETQLASAKLDALQQQLQPHFLFNSLHAIASLAREGRQADVVQMIANLSDLLRTVTDRASTTQSLAAELELARRYLEIQSVRFGDRLRFEVDAPADVLGLAVPTLTLQPLVDNAVRHGVTPTMSGGVVRVKASRHGSLLQIVIEDSGGGVPPEWSLEKSTGTGLKNLMSRVAILYGDRAAVAVNPTGPGFAVVITLPAVPV